MRRFLSVSLVALVIISFGMVTSGKTGGGGVKVTLPSQPISENYGFVRLHSKDGKILVKEGEYVYVVITPTPEIFSDGTQIIFEKQADTGVNLKGNVRVNLKIIKK
jgi:hypothetical protein